MFGWTAIDQRRIAQLAKDALPFLQPNPQCRDFRRSASSSSLRRAWPLVCLNATVTRQTSRLSSSPFSRSAPTQRPRLCLVRPTPASWHPLAPLSTKPHDTPSHHSWCGLRTRLHPTANAVGITAVAVNGLAVMDTPARRGTACRATSRRVGCNARPGAVRWRHALVRAALFCASHVDTPVAFTPPISTPTTSPRLISQPLSKTHLYWFSRSRNTPK